MTPSESSGTPASDQLIAEIKEWLERDRVSSRYMGRYDLLSIVARIEAEGAELAALREQVVRLTLERDDTRIAAAHWRTEAYVGTEMRDAGRGLANCAYYLAQSDRLPTHDRVLLKKSYERWDAADSGRTVIGEGEATPLPAVMADLARPFRDRADASEKREAALKTELDELRPVGTEKELRRERNEALALAEAMRVAGKPLAGIADETRLALDKWLLCYAAFTGGTYAVLNGILWYFDATLPAADSAILVLSILAQFLLDNKKLETWAVWAAVNVLAIYVYANAGLTLVALQFVLFLANTVYGFVQWRASRKVDGYTQERAHA